MKRSPLIILFITVMLDLLGFGIILPLLPLYVRHFHGGPAVSGWLAASFSVMQFIFAPIWGRMSDKYGRRPMILIGLLGSALSFLAYGLATQLWMLFVSRIFAGALTAASLPTAQAYISDVMPPEKRSRGMAMIGVAFGIGFSTGPWIGGQLGKYGLAVPAFAVAGLSFANFLWSLYALPESHTKRDAEHARRVTLFDTSAFRRAWHNPALRELLTVFTTASFAFSLMEATFTWLVILRFIDPQMPLHASMYSGETRAAATVGPIFGVVGIASVLSQGAVMGGMAQKIGEVKLILLGSLLLSISLFGIGATHSLGQLTVLAALLSVANGMMGPALSSMVSKSAGPNEKGSVLGVQQGLGSLGRMTAPPLGTWLLQSIRPLGVPYFLAGSLMFIVFLLSLNLRKQEAILASAEGTSGYHAE